MVRHNDLSLKELVDALMNHLEETGFSLNTRTRLLAYYKVLLKYAEKLGIGQFSLDMGKRFLLEHHRHPWSDTERLTASQNYLQRHILILHEFQAYGEIRHKRRLKKIYHLPHFQDVIDAYIACERDKGLKASTLKSKQFALYQIFEYLEDAGLSDTRAITVEHVYGFFSSKQYYAVATKEAYQYIFRSLIKYLYENGLCGSGLSQLFPVISVHTKNAYPSCFTPAEISKVLQCVKTDTSGGKRDYLILLLAAGLGIRCGDICKLKIENIDWNGRKLSFIQSKTGDSVNLSMADEIFYALLDYLKNARPSCDFKEILVCDRAPIQPFKSRTFYEMLQKYLSAAGINTDEDQKHGLHSLRSSLAGNMLRSGVTLPVISNVLGHKYADTTSIYLKIDLDGLRKAALEVPAL